MRSNSRICSTTMVYMLSVSDFDPKGTISEVRVHAGGKFGHTGLLSIGKCSQSSRRKDTGGFRSWPTATCRFSTRRSFDHHGKENSNSVKKCFENEKKWNLFVSLIDLIVIKTLSTVRLPVTVSSVQMFSLACGKKFSPGHTQLPTSRNMPSAL